MNITDIEIIGDKLLIKPRPRDKELGGVEIQDTARQKVEVGTVVKLGTGWFDSDGELIPFTCEVGDKILFDWLSGTNMKINNESFIILKNDNISGVIDE